MPVSETRMAGIRRDRVGRVAGMLTLSEECRLAATHGVQSEWVGSGAGGPQV